MTNVQSPHIHRRTQLGMTLVELMVALVLGLLTTLIVAQVMINAEGQRRTTTNTTDAQINGASALYLLGRDLQAAGYGLISKSTVRGCPVRWANGNTAVSNLALTPVSISTDANGNSVIRTLSSGNGDFAVPVAVSDGRLPDVLASSGFQVQSNLGIQSGDLLLATPPTWDASNWCLIFPAGTITTATGIPISGISEAAVSDEQKAEFGGFGPEVFPSGGYALESTVINLGATPDLREYRVDSNTLQVRRLLDTGAWGDWQTLTPGVVRLVALYGMDTSVPADGRVDAYTDTTPSTADNWSRLLTVRIAVVTRSAQFERPQTTTEGGVTTTTRVTNSSPTWRVGHQAVPVQGAAACSSTTNAEGETENSEQQCISLTIAGTPADGTPPEQDWRNYRYKTYDTVVPLRNQVWSPQ